MRYSSILMSIADCTNCSMLMHQTFLLITHKSDLRKSHHPIAIAQLCLWLPTTLTTSLLCAVQLLILTHRQMRCFRTMVTYKLRISTNPRKTYRLRCCKLKNMIVSLYTMLIIIIISNITSMVIKFIHHHKPQFSLWFCQLWGHLLSSSLMPMKVRVKYTPLL